ncbi:hypothetical protein [Sphingomonas sp. PR090111-T3T-6A]|uniref:hypothetical protein n=1 Tax=Sphingomonas sp. PR090111-T3T-6A TaxID=685778 RepID=UPI00037F44F4|nr:hypothetical protein [Sphingomonas sp. PR090111-T3T-6A]
MARYLRRNPAFSIDATAFTLLASMEGTLAITLPRVDIMSAMPAIASVAAAILIALELYDRCAFALGSIRYRVDLMRRSMGASFPTASGATALAFVGAESWSFDRLIRDRRTNDRSERP